MKNVVWIAFQIKMTANYQIVLKIINFNGTPHSRAILQIEFSVFFSISQDSILSKRESYIKGDLESYIKGDLESYIKLAFSNFNQFEK